MLPGSVQRTGCAYVCRNAYIPGRECKGSKEDTYSGSKSCRRRYAGFFANRKKKQGSSCARKAGQYSPKNGFHDANGQILMAVQQDQSADAQEDLAEDHACEISVHPHIRDKQDDSTDADREADDVPYKNRRCFSKTMQDTGKGSVQVEDWAQQGQSAQKDAGELAAKEECPGLLPEQQEAGQKESAQQNARLKSGVDSGADLAAVVQGMGF